MSEPPSATDSLRSITPEAAGRYHLPDGRPLAAAGAEDPAEMGRGGIGRVLLAFDEHLGREVALKELLPDAAGSAGEARARFLREARVTGQLEHPGIVPVYELGRRPDGTPYYTMRVVRGRTLAEVLGEARGLPGRLALLTHFVDLCEAIAYAHSRGVVHRDIKPANVMLGEFGETVVLDWGLAKVRGRRDPRGEELGRAVRLLAEGDAGTTQAGSALGTPAYMSPEQALGQIDEIDERSDVWSLGAVLYELLAGHPPFPGANAWEVLGQVMRKQVRPVRAACPEAPAELASVCEKALCRQPDGRYPGAAELAAEVKAFLTGGRVRAYDYRAWEILARWASRHRAPLATALLALLLLLTLGVVSYLEVRSGLDLARSHLAAAQLEGARAALARGDPLEARAKLRNALEARDSLAGRALWIRQAREPLLWGAQLLPTADQALITRDGREVILGQQDDGSVYRLEVATRALHVDRGRLPGGHGWLVYEPALERFASVGADGSLHLWSRSAPAPRALEGPPSRAVAADFLPGAGWLASSHADGRVCLWDTATGRLALTLRGLAEGRTFFGASGDGRRLAGTSPGRGAVVWELGTGAVVGRLPDADGVLSCTALDPRGERAASGTNRGRLWIWEVATGRILLDLHAHPDNIRSLAFSPDGRRLATGGGEGAVKLWDARSGENLAVLRGNLDVVHSVNWSPDGQRLTSVDWAGGLRLWNAAARADPPGGARGHLGQVNSVRFSPDGQRLLSADWKGCLRQWSVATGAQEAVVQGYQGTLLGFSPGGERLLTEDWRGVMHLWDARALSRERTLGGHEEQVTAAAFSADGARLATGAKDRSLRLWDVTSSGALEVCRGLPGAVGDVSFDPGGAALGAAASGRQLELWEVPACTLRARLTGPGEALGAIALGPGGLTAAAAGDEIWLWRGTAGRRLARLAAPATRLRFRPDGGLLAVACQDGSAQLLPLDGSAPRRLDGHSGALWDVAFSPDGGLLASAGSDWTVRLWRSDTGQPAWRAPALVAAPGEEPRVLTHAGWQAPGGPGLASPPGGDHRPARWREAVERARLARQSPDGGLCLDDGAGHLQLWDRVADRQLASAPAEGADALIALRGPACAFLTGGRVGLLAAGGEAAVQLVVGAEALGSGADGAELLVAAGERVHVFDALGHPRGEGPGGLGVAALLGLGDRLVLGFPEGHLEVRPRQATGAPGLNLEEVPEHAPTALAAGPAGSLIVGFADGLVGLWDLDSGERLLHAKLHGPVRHLLLDARGLSAASELGDHLRWELDDLARPYCELLEALWAQVPIAWEGGRPVARPRPGDHPCAR
ncbi:MAG TPA: protein kinase [Myxococcota bacterium]|nr:protein kinase [Myxococcota bacterium]HRY94406.1 protein kinase [Myxococcota bacterium]HSA22468.1 protein kinase [Myxococcota bacterium]